MTHVPAPWEFVLLALAAMRLTRLIGWDSITDGLRSRITGHHHGGSKTGRRAGSRRDKPEWMLFLTCPWCLGFWISAAVWAAWLGWPNATLIACTPFAISAVVGLVVKTLDS
ncbi:MAG TPA: DUF1360 domain-containing protein [Gemmatimonadales bacterium]|nr:DUF1360 domain-containing protein [Gemmatimonadales bacterium]